jgi:hypothetical protein
MKHRARITAPFNIALAMALLTACAGDGTDPRVAAGSPERRLVEIAPSMHTVSGPLASFDPANPSVEFRLPATRPAPLVIFVHGGGGAGDVRAVMGAVHAAGVAVLGFDAYRMNGFDRPSGFWVRNMTYEARQRMIFTTALGAYRWAVRQDGVDPSRIHIYGISNGADVVANLAAVVDPTHVRTVFAEGIAGAGLGLPDRLAVPVRAIFGRVDNYAGQTETDWRWQRRVPCRLNMAGFDGPPGNAAACNEQVNPRGRTQSPAEWIGEQRTKGADIDTWFYDDGAHGIFIGPLRRQTMAWPSGVLHASVGGTDAARQAMLGDLLARIATAR